MIILSFGAIILTQLPLIIFDLRHNLLNLRGIIRLILTPGTRELSFGEKLANRWGVFKENLLTTQTVFYYRNDFNDFGGVHKIKGKIQALDYIYKDAGGKPFNLLVFTPPVYTYAYDYLLWWYGREKYGYEPERKKERTFYLLIEPDPHQPWTYKGWLETVIKIGKIIETKELPSGFIIQKRFLGENER
jgi:hypothetical protein